MVILNKTFELCIFRLIDNPLYHRVLKRSVTYKSALSLANLYPNSCLKLTTPEPPQGDKNGFNGYIPIKELQITYSKSTGPGGQNVNNVNTKADVRFHLQTATWLCDEMKKKLAETLRTRMNKEGYVIYKSDLTRFQHLNLAHCLEKIRSNIRECSVEKKEPSLESEEMIRRRFERAARERLLIKRTRSQLKNTRQCPDNVDL